MGHALDLTRGVRFMVSTDLVGVQDSLCLIPFDS
jgi:hypothetical protein